VEEDCAAGSGILSLDQSRPFHRSPSAGTPMSSPSLSPPTAMQALADVHETALRPSTGTPSTDSGPPIVSNDHVRPFHRSVSMPVSWKPTNMHVLADAQDTAVTAAPAGLGAL